jgi:hypothetical protein
MVRYLVEYVLVVRYSGRETHVCKCMEAGRGGRHSLGRWDVVGSREGYKHEKRTNT